MKKSISVILFIILVMALSVTAFAEEEYLVETSSLGSEKSTIREIKGAYVGKNFETTFDSVVGAKMFSKSGSIPDGMKISGTWTYKNTFGDYVFSAIISGTPTKAGTYNFSVNYLKDDGKTIVATKNYSITVGEKAPFDYVGSIMVEKWPNKTEYYLGDTIDLTGMKVTAVAYIYDSKTKIYCPFQLDITDLVWVDPTIVYSKELDEVAVCLKVPGNPQGELKTFNDSFQIKVIDKIIASGYCGGESDGTNLEWSITSDGTLTISGEGKMADYGDFGETYMEDAPWVEYKDDIKSLVLEEGITYIGGCAFYQNPLDPYLSGKLIIPKSVTIIGTGAFAYGRNFEGDIYISENVTNVGRVAFMEVGAESFTVAEDNKNYASFDGMLCSKNMKRIITCPTGKKGEIEIPETITRIEMFSFRFCEKLTGNLVLPKNLEEIGKFAFYGCSGLKGKLDMPRGIKSLNYSLTFAECGIDEFYFYDDAPSGVQSTGMPTFDFDDTIYYPLGNSTWEIVDGKWNGYTAIPYDPDTIIFGDVNGDRKVNVLDANLVRRYAAKLVELDDKQLTAADVNGDTKVNVLDANLIRRYAAKLIYKFPIEE